MKYFYFIWFTLVLHACSKEKTESEPLNFIKYSINGSENFNFVGSILNPEIKVSFSTKLDPSTVKAAVSIYDYSGKLELDIILTKDDSTLIVKPKNPLKYLTKYDFAIDNQLKAFNGNNLISSIQSSFTTILDETDKLPQISDEELINLTQKQTFKYFWDFGHPVSGLSRERNTSGDLVTSGGSGFGIMTIVIGVERGFITRAEGLERLLKMTNFLINKAERFHGVYPHWLNGATGKTIPFSTKDDGGDIVETSYLLTGLLCASEYFDQSNAKETQLRLIIKEIWESVEWNWHTKGSENVLYWHWSPKYNWEMNHQLRGWNEALITYILAAASPTYPINKDVYDKGWASNGTLKNGKTYFNLLLPLGPELGGPLFFAHYSFLGINPKLLKDKYADYWQQVVKHSLINYEYCKANPKGYYRYGKDCWGLTASDTRNGYDAHSPTNDKGVISPTAALSSIAFTPAESMEALKFFYYKLGDKIFKEYGFTDAFNLSSPWFATSFLAIDQGPIIIMIENYRSQLIWNNTMKNKDIRTGMTKLGFTY